jgi:hypothetical protein
VKQLLRASNTLFRVHTSQWWRDTPDGMDFVCRALHLCEGGVLHLVEEDMYLAPGVWLFIETFVPADSRVDAT